ncbi:hypothetical protein [Chitinophaga sp. RAB17]|uniref:hypothetical protein n=1 Tax=Chitinophaga sp. RAB17 TaxID=3233049 RepID=UPI003F906B56
MAADVNARFNGNYLKDSDQYINNDADLKNKNYKGTNKYMPLILPKEQTINLVNVKAHMQKRIDSFKIRVNFNELYFRGITDDEITANEKGKDPPIVVMSSGRASWIKAAMQNGDNAIAAAAGKFSGKVTDELIFTNGPVPFYYPKRYTNENTKRNFYIFVHQTEYEFYVNELSDYDITVIGWSTLKENIEPKKDYDLCLGFGMSRYVVFQFFKDFYKQKNSPTHKRIWMLDDNLCHIKGFPGFTACEGLSQNPGVGFFVAKTLCAEQFFTNLGSKAQGKSIGDELINFAQDTLSFLQQATLWNFAQIPDELSFSPYFIASNEDITFGRMLKQYSTNVSHTYSSATILKCQIPAPPQGTKIDPGLITHNNQKKVINLNLSEAANRGPLTILNMDTRVPKDLFDFLNDIAKPVSKKETKDLSFVKSGEQIVRTGMHQTNAGTFDAVPQECFITSGEFRIHRNASTIAPSNT